jgi:hypothetical protein
MLLLFRPGVTVRDDPDFAAALELAKSDPELARWFEEYCAAQIALRAKFREIPVPEGLREQILSERKAHFSRDYLRKAAFTVAATVLLCLGVVLFYPRAAAHNTFSNYRGRMAGTVLRQYPKMDLVTADQRQIQQYLASKGQGNYALPPELARTTATGCALLDWRGKPVTMICFDSGKTTPPGAADLFLFIIDRSALADAPANPPQEATPSRFSRLTTAGWSSGDKTYLLGALGDEKFLRNHL